MKKCFATQVVLVPAIFLIIQACDKIEPPYREQTDGGVTLGDNSIVLEGDTFTFVPDTSQVKQKIFLEDYTGHLCQNCPPAAQTLYTVLHPLYGTQLISIGVHAGEFADVCPAAIDCPGNAPSGSFLIDYRNAAGNDWNTTFGIQGYPCGMINRTGYPTSHIKPTGNWSSTIQGMINNIPKVRIRILNRYDASTLKLKTAIEAKFLFDTTNTYKLSVILVEDSITDWQRWLPHTPEFVPDYLHRNVLRTGINGSFGTTISSGFIVNGTIKINGFVSTLNSAWDAQHCKVIAFLYDASNYLILQVEEQAVK